MTTQSLEYGKSTIRWQSDKDGGFAGVVVANGKRTDPISDEDEDRLLARLKNEAGKLHPHYIGIQAAIDRFLDFMPGGFTGERSEEMEGEYKRKASAALNDVLPLSAAREATNAEAMRVRQAPVWINLLSPYESMHLKEALESDTGGAFLQGAAKFADGNHSEGAAAMERAIADHGRLSWPTATYFPYLWQPDRHMFLKPVATCDFAERTGHPFQFEYKPSISGGVYEGLLDLAGSTLEALRPHGARDFVDVQSFIWVVGAYDEEHRPDQAGSE